MANAAEELNNMKTEYEGCQWIGKLESVISITAVSKEEQGKKPDCNV